MLQWQTQYLANTREIIRLSGIPQADGPQALRQAVEDRRGRTLELVAENNRLVREYLFPMLETVTRAPDDIFENLQAFAAALTAEGRLDNCLALHIHEGLLTAARSRHDRCLLLRELYECGLGTFYALNSTMTYRPTNDILRRIRLYFREAASYLRLYDQIPSTEARGYIHRSMGNIALSYGRNELMQKLKAINDSLRVLTDPYYREKTPDLPWDSFVYATHQERTSLLYCLRSGDTTPELVSQVMESAQYVYNIQLARSQALRRPVEPRWRMVYAGALFFSGINDVRTYLDEVVEIHYAATPGDYSYGGIIGNADSVAYFLDALGNFGSSQQGECLGTARILLNRALRYIAAAPQNVDMSRAALRLMQAYYEFPGFPPFAELFCRLAPFAARDVYLHSAACGEICRVLAQLVLAQRPQLLDRNDLTAAALPKLAQTAGLLHDLGVFFFPRSMMVPARAMLDFEQELLSIHSQFGADQVARHPSTQAVCKAVLGHHWPLAHPETYRRSQDATPLLTDLLAVADALCGCVMPNHPGIYAAPTADECFHRLDSNSNSQFHPALVSLVRENRANLEDAIEKTKHFIYDSLSKNIVYSNF